MRTVEEVEARIRSLLCEELNRRIKEASERLPHRCTHNHRQPLDSRKLVDGEPNENYNRITSRQGLPVLQTMGLCMLGADDPMQWKGTICEDPIDAQRCPVFEPVLKKDELWREFCEQTKDPEWVHLNMPQVAELQWVMAESFEVALPWWKRLWFKILRIHIVKTLPPFDPERLLPMPEEPKMHEARL